MIYPSEVAQRYADAFYDLLASQNQIDVILKDFEMLSEVLKQPIQDSPSPQNMLSLLSGPLLNTEQKINLLQSILYPNSSSEKISQKNHRLLSFLKFLIYKNRIHLILEIIMAFQYRHNEDRGVIKGEVFSDQHLTPEEKQIIERFATQKLNKTVHFEYCERPSVLGGVLVKVGGFLFDGTAAGQLHLLKDQLINNIDVVT